jgi:hypothetical protein
LKPEWWGSPLVEEDSTREERTVTRDLVMIIMMMMDDLPEYALPAVDLNTKLTKQTSKSLHGKCLKQLHQPVIDLKAAHSWLRRNDTLP